MRRNTARLLLDEWNNYAKWVGENRGPYCGVGKSLQKAGLTFALSSDAPIGPINPFEHVFAAVNRTDRNGHPRGGWIPVEKLDFDTAFLGYTSIPPYLEFWEGKKGVIKKDAKADFIMLEEHPDSCPDGKINTIEVQQTWLDGKKVFDRAANRSIFFDLIKEFPAGLPRGQRGKFENLRFSLR